MDPVPLFGPGVSIGKVLAGEDITAEEFVQDTSPWVTVVVPPDYPLGGFGDETTIAKDDDTTP